MILSSELFIFFLYYFYIVPSIIFLAIITSLIIYWKYFYQSNNKNREEEEQRDDRNDENQEPKNLITESLKTKKSSPNSTSKTIKDRIVMTKEIDQLIQKILDKLLEYYILIWYRPLVVAHSTSEFHQQQLSKQSVDRLRETLRDNLWILISCFIDRLYNVNHVTFISQNLVNCLLKHFQNLNQQQQTNQFNTHSNGLLHSRSDYTIFSHRKNQPSSSSISSTNSNMSLFFNDDPKTSTNNSMFDKQIKKPFTSFINQSKTQILNNLNPFKQNSGTTLKNFSENIDDQTSTKPDDKLKQKSLNDNQNDENSTVNSDEVFYPLASHLVNENAEKSLIQTLTAFILKTLLNDITKSYDHGDQRKKYQHEYELSLIENSQTIRSLLNDIISKVLFHTINTLSEPKLINCQFVMILKRYFIMKDLLFQGEYPRDRQSQFNLHSDSVSKSFNQENSEDDDDDDDGSEDGDNLSKCFIKKNTFILNEMKQCIAANDFDHLYELIDKCNNIKILKHIRLKLIDEILDAAVVSHLDKTNSSDQSSQQKKPYSIFYKQKFDINNSDKQQNEDKIYLEASKHENSTNQAENDSDLLTRINRISGNMKQTNFYHQSQLNPDFNFNAKMNLKFKKYKQEKNIKRLIMRLRYAKTLCEQKIQFRKRILASLLPIEETNQQTKDTSKDDQPKEFSTERDFSRQFSYDISFKNDLVKSISTDDSIIYKQQINTPSLNLQDQFVNDEITTQLMPSTDFVFIKPKQKKIFTFQQIIGNKFSRDYFKMFLQQSLLQNDSSMAKRSSIMKFRKDVLLVDCTVYMLEFWEHLQLLFDNFQRYYCLVQKSNESSSSLQLYELFRDSFHLMYTMMTDHRFFYTFSKQFLWIPQDLMHSLERFLLGDLELEAIDLSQENFNLFDFQRNTENFILFQKLDESITEIDQEQSLSSSFYVLKRINWFKYLDVFFRLEKILFNCLHEEFYPQFLISDEYDQMLYCYFEHQKSIPKCSINTWKPLINLKQTLSSDNWYHMWNNNGRNNSITKSKLTILEQVIKLKPINKIMLSTIEHSHQSDQSDDCNQQQQSTLSKQKRSIDLQKNRKMLSNSIEFPFVYLYLVKLIMIIRVKLKLTIKMIIVNHQESTTNQICKDLLPLLLKDIKDICQSIKSLNQILLRTFCWLNADFSCAITNVKFKKHYLELLQSSMANTTESKIFSFVETLFSKNTTSIMMDGNSSWSSNLIFKVNVTALLSRFQYHQPRSFKTLPDTIRNELMPHWSYQWSVEMNFNQLQTFHQKTIKPFLRIILFLSRFHIRNYSSTIMDIINANLFNDAKLRSYQTIDNVSLTSTSKNKIFDFLLNNKTKNIPNTDGSSSLAIINSEIKILEKFLNTSNHILLEINQMKRLMLNDMKNKMKQQKPISSFGPLSVSTAMTKIPNIVDDYRIESNKNKIKQSMEIHESSVSFKKLLHRESQLSIDFDVQEATESLKLSPDTSENDQPECNIFQQNQMNLMMKQMENLFNIFFQQITAQELIVKSTGFLHLIGYDNYSNLTTKSKVNEASPSSWCLRCNMTKYLFESNQDYGLNHQVQLYLFRLLFDQQQESSDDDEYWNKLIDQMVTNVHDYHNNPQSTGGLSSSSLLNDQNIGTLKFPFFSSSNTNNNLKTTASTETSNANLFNTNNATSRLLFMQIRSMLSEKSSRDCFDFCLDTLKCFQDLPNPYQKKPQKENLDGFWLCKNCLHTIAQSKRRILFSSSSSIRISNQKKFRLFNVQPQDESSTTVSSCSNILDNINTNNTSSFTLTNLFRSMTSSKQSNSHQYIGSQVSNIPDLLLNEALYGGNGAGVSIDEPSMVLMSLDESQLIEPFFKLLIEIFELKGGTVTSTLRRTLMFAIRLFFGRPYKQFLQSLFTEENVFKLLSQVDLYLDNIIKNYKIQQQQQWKNQNSKSKLHSKINNNPTIVSKVESENLFESSQIDTYLDKLNQILCSLENQKLVPEETTCSKASSEQSGTEPYCASSVLLLDQDIEQYSNLVDSDGIMLATELESKLPSSSSKILAGESSETLKTGINEENSKVDEEHRKLQILAKQLLFASVPTFMNHLFGQEYIKKGLNKFFDILQYQQLNKHLIYEFIQTFMLEYFPEFRKL